MPRLTTWRARRSAFLRERRRFEAQEAAKWRKEAIRCCRNCLSAYRDQTPAGGKFMCTCCGHVSRRPVLDVPAGTPNPGGISGAFVGQAGATVTLQSLPGAGDTLGSSGARSGDARGPWGGGGWPERKKFSSFFGVSLVWTANKAAPRGSSSSTWATHGFPWCSKWGGERPDGNFAGWFFGKENCTADSSFLFLLFRMFLMVFICLRWLGQKAWNGDTIREELAGGGRRGRQRKGDDAGSKEGSRGDKARRKAEEKRQARITKEQMEAEERRQREEVARLVEERRRLRDEKLQAERVSEREAAAEREREVRRERDVERRRQEKLKERVKYGSSILDAVEDFVGSSKKEHKRRDGKGKCSQERKSSEIVKNLDAMKCFSGAGEFSKLFVKSAKVDMNMKGADSKMAEGWKAGRCITNLNLPVAAKSKLQNAKTASMWDKNSNAGASKGTGSSGILGVKSVQTLCAKEVTSKGKVLDTACSPWKNIRRSNVWGKAASTPASGKAGISAFPSNIEVQLGVGSDCLDRGSLSGVAHTGAFCQNELVDLADLVGKKQEIDSLNQSGDAPVETLFSQSLTGTRCVAPIGTQQTIPAPLSGARRNSDEKQLSCPMFEPWADDLNSDRKQSGYVPALVGVDPTTQDNNWRMWEAPQLDQIQRSNIQDAPSPLAWMLPLELTPDGASPSGAALSAELDPRLPDHFFSPQAQHSCSTCSLTLPSVNESLCSDQPPFVLNSSMRNWEASAALLQEPVLYANHKNSASHEVMHETTVVDHSYDRSSMTHMLQNHDTRPICEEILPSSSGRRSALDESFRSEHILPGQILDQQESWKHKEKVGTEESSNSWPMKRVSAAWSDPMANGTHRLNNIGGFYTAPSAQSVWSYNTP